MKTNQESFSYINEYIGIDKRKLIIFFSLLLGVFVVVTGIYVAIFGYQDWKTNMQRAGSMMVANFDQPQVPASPVIGVPAVQPTLAPSYQPTVQYACPQCGIAGLPNWSANGAPLCPRCGSLMSINNQNTLPPGLRP
jgi:predicted RNA-binding Zn-ribbon protein involved in translation (DUF1610 family)